MKAFILLYLMCSVFYVAVSMIQPSMLTNEKVLDFGEERMFATEGNENELAVLLTVQKIHHESRFCCGHVYNSRRILTTATCVKDALMVDVQHYNKDTGNYDNHFYLDSTSIKIHPKYNDVGKPYNLAFLRIPGTPLPFNQSGYYFVEPVPGNLHPFIQILFYKKRPEIAVVAPYFVKSDETKTYYPKMGLAWKFDLRSPFECRIQMMADKRPILHGEYVFILTTEFCIKADESTENTLCMYDEGAPVFQDFYEVINGKTKRQLKLLGLVNYNNRDCSEFTPYNNNATAKPKGSALYTYISPISLVLDWIKKFGQVDVAWPEK